MSKPITQGCIELQHSLTLYCRLCRPGDAEIVIHAIWYRSPVPSLPFQRVLKPYIPGRGLTACCRLRSIAINNSFHPARAQENRSYALDSSSKISLSAGPLPPSWASLWRSQYYPPELNGGDQTFTGLVMLLHNNSLTGSIPDEWSGARATPA